MRARRDPNVRRQLRVSLASGTPEERRDAAHALVLLRDPDAVDTLVAVLRAGQEPPLWIADPNLFRTIREALELTLDHDEWFLREQALAVDPEPRARRVAVACLRLHRGDGSRVIELLQALAADADPAVAADAHGVLAEHCERLRIAARQLGLELPAACAPNVDGSAP